MNDANNANDNIEWVRCDRRECEKWRKLPTGISADSFDNKWWECSMNTWNASIGCCDAPEEKENAQHDEMSISEFQLRQNDNSLSDSSEDESSNNNDSGGSVYEYNEEEEDSEDEESICNSCSESEFEEEEDFEGEELIDVLNGLKLDDKRDSWPNPPLPLSDKHKMTELSEIEDLENVALQKLLYDLNVQYTLFDHQFEAVRKVAGVPDSFPFHLGNAIPSSVKDTWQRWKDIEDQFTKDVNKYEPLTSHDENHTSMLVKYSDQYKQRLKLHKEIFPIDILSDICMKDAIFGLDLSQNIPHDKGFCLADLMGLGKTIEAIFGAILMNAIFSSEQMAPNACRPYIRKPSPAAPTLIVSPNDAVQDQWRDTLIKNGVLFEDVVIIKKKKDIDGRNFLGQFKFVLSTRHTIQADIKDLVIDNERTMSSFFQSTPKYVVDVMYEVYEKKPARSKWTLENEKPEDTITRLASFSNPEQTQFSFSLLIIDEAHILKNRLTYASIACVLAGSNASRVVSLTGTPYNNSTSDLATIMTFIDPQLPMAKTCWWDNAQEQGVLKDEADRWSTRFVLRRDKEEIAHLLPEKKVSSNFRVKTTLAQLDKVYMVAEENLVSALKRMARLKDDPRCDPKILESSRRIMMSRATIVRMANIHPMLPGSGREVTRLFSPSRCHNISKNDCPRRCVCCEQNMRPSIILENCKTESFNTIFLASDKGPKKRSYKGNSTLFEFDKMEELKDDYDDDVDVFCSTKEQDDLPPLPNSLCDAHKLGSVHYAHDQCIAKLQLETKRCPRCVDLHYRRTDASTGLIDPTEGTFWCTDIIESMPEGFASSPKIDEAVKFIKQKKTDKVIIVSFFKSALDLFEGILTHHRNDFGGGSVARFDGDTKDKSAELKLFKENPKCRFLLMTVQSGGIGLNLTQARRLLMLDRWYNPFVHEQVEDRIYRIGQKSNVEIRYFDTAGTIDEVMREINLSKKKNSQTLLDKINGNKDDEYQELGGMMWKLLRTVIEKREEFEKKIKNDQTCLLNRCTSPIPRIKANEMKSAKKKTSNNKQSHSTKKSSHTHTHKQTSNPTNHYSPVRNLKYDH